MLRDFGDGWRDSAAMAALPVSRSDTISAFFHVRNGKSVGERHYSEGPTPYISSGDATNSIIRLVSGDADEVFAEGGITVTAFGQASLQPWPFVARGNGGSSVRVLIPRFRMTVRELVWFAAQINAQRWRFFYARMAIKSRLERLVVSSPTTRLPDDPITMAERVERFQDAFSRASNGAPTVT